MRARACPVQAVLASTRLRALQPHIEALAVLFLALGLFAVAVFSVGTVERAEGELVFAFGDLSCSF